MNNLLVGYLFVNFLMFLCLVKCKMKIMRVSYLIALICLLFVLLASDENSFVASWITDLYGREYYLMINESINFPVIGSLSAISAIQLIIMLLFFIVCVILAMKTVEKVRAILRKISEVKLKRPLKNLITQLFKAKYTQKIYLTKCVMLC